MGREAGVGNVTLSRYHDLLRALYLVDPLPAWAASVAKRMIKAPKVTFPDTGLAAYLLGVTQTRLESDRTLFGALLENFVVGEVRRQLGWSGVAAQAFHYRTAGEQEVDLLLGHRDGRLAGIEVKAARTVTSSDFRGLRALQDELGLRFHRGVMLYTGEATIPFGDRLLAAPIGTLWQSHEAR